MTASARSVLIRVGSAVVTLLGVSIIVFVAIHRVPGGYEQVVLGPFAAPETRAAVAEKYGLDRSLVGQYLRWLRQEVVRDLRRAGAGVDRRPRTSAPQQAAGARGVHPTCARDDRARRAGDDHRPRRRDLV